MIGYRRDLSACIAGALAAIILIYAGWKVIATTDAIARRDVLVRQIRDTQADILRKQDETLNVLKAQAR